MIKEIVKQVAPHGRAKKRAAYYSNQIATAKDGRAAYEWARQWFTKEIRVLEQARHADADAMMRQVGRQLAWYASEVPHRTFKQ